MYVSGNHAYVASYGSNALEIVDITNPATPIHKNSTYIDTPRSVFVSGNYAYVTSAGSDALEVVDVTNPAAPVLKGTILNGGTTLLNNPYSVYVSGNYAYVASYSSNALEIVDVTNPAAPVHKGSITNIFLSSPQSVSVSGNYAYIASDGINALDIVDVTNPATPVHKGYIQDGSGVAPFLRDPVGVYISGNYAYVASLASNALEIVDIGSVTATSVNVVSANQITCSVNLSDKTAGLYNVVVTNPDGKSGALPNGFTISAAGAPVASFYGTPLAGAVSAERQLHRHFDQFSCVVVLVIRRREFQYFAEPGTYL